MPDGRIEKLLELVLTGITMLLLIEQEKETRKPDDEQEKDMIRVINQFVEEEQAFLGKKFKFRKPSDGDGEE